MIKSSLPPIRRIIHIDEEIRSRRYPNCKTLAQNLEVSRKTVQRDIIFLRDQLKAPIDFDTRKRGYYYTCVFLHIRRDGSGNDSGTTAKRSKIWRTEE